MKKILICLLCLGLLTGCNSDEVGTKELETYYSYVEKTLQTQTVQNKSNYYDIKLTMNKLENGTYRFDVIIDNPKVAMQNIEAVVVVNGVNYQTGEFVFPTLGVLESSKYNMTPNQVNKSKGYYKGVDLSGITDNDHIDVRVFVKFKKESDALVVEEYIELSAIYVEPEIIDDNADTSDTPEEAVE